jgi:DDE superfamily endonuclease
VATGKVMGDCVPRHRAKEFIGFLKKIDTAVDKVLDLHLVLDNYATHKTKRVQNWLKRHKRFHLHFIPTSSSWLNLVERFFASINEDAIRRGVFKSVADLEATIAVYLANHNVTSKPFVWTKSADVILRKVERAKATLAAVKNRNQALESAH